MKIMVVGPTDADSFADNVTSSLRAMGHEVLAAGPARDVKGPRKARNALHLAADQLASVDSRVQRGLVSRARAFCPELVITLDVRLRPATVQGLHDLGSKVVLWFPDAVSNLGKHEVFLCGYDRMYFKNPHLVEQLNTLHGLPAAYMPEAANPSWHRPIGPYGTNRTIVVAGNIHPTRALLLERLLSAGIPLTLYGPALSSWMDFPRLREIHTGRLIVREEKAKVFRESRAVLNNLHPAEYAGSNCRLFEATASGAVALTEWRAGMDSLFDPDYEVLGFKTFDELVRHCRALLEDPEHGRPIADAGARRALSDHTYTVRLRAMLDDLESA